MLYPKHFEEKIGFDKIRELLTAFCLSASGRKLVLNMQFINDFDRLQLYIAQFKGMYKLLSDGNTFPVSELQDIQDELKKAKIIGNWLTEEELYKVKLFVNSIQLIVKFIKINVEVADSPLLELIKQVYINPLLLKELDAIIDDKGRLRDNASPELRAIRYELLTEQGALRRLSDSLLRKYKSDGYIQDDSSVTIRGGRLVLPVIAEFKRKIKGFILDESATGQTAYLEPVELLETNNRIKELEYMEKREIVRLLTMLTASVSRESGFLEKALSFMAIVDFLRAKTLLAHEINGVIPEIQKDTAFYLYQAKHPLLYLSHKKVGKDVRPLTLKLDATNRLLVISGPNAGGKSVTLKTTGLLQYMAQSGLPVSASEASVFGFYKDIFIDIGDQQSIENDLSTYSSHLSAMQYFLTHAGGKSLILIDEFGAGTEPQYGGAIAESILFELNKKKATGVITTHYANLKKMAEQTEGLFNGAMKYDLDKLEPLYELEVGHPGSSFALEIAEKIGLPAYVIKQARHKVGASQVNFDKLLAQVQHDKQEIESYKAIIEKNKVDLEEKVKYYDGLNEFLDQNKKTILNEAKTQAKRIIEDANKLIENTIRDIKEAKADKEIVKVLRDEIVEKKKTLLTEPVKKVKSTNFESLEGPIEVGSFVKIIDSGNIGEVLEIRNKEALVSLGEIKSWIKIARLQKVSGKEKTKQEKSNYSYSLASAIGEKTQNFTGSLDVRGMRGEETISALAHFIDTAIIVGSQQLRIVHGKGDGILRQLIRDYLKNINQVTSWQNEHPDMGGDGVTVVFMK